MSRGICQRFVIVLCLVAGGCAGYRIGPMLQADYKSIAVPMFANKTLTPQLEAQITNGILKRLQADGSLRIDSVANADVVLTGEILRYNRHPLRSLRNESGTPREYRISIDARVEARSRATGKTVVPAMVLTGYADTFIGSDLQAAEQQLLPLIADDLARQVVTLLVEKW
jgi:hypothetical protein